MRQVKSGQARTLTAEQKEHLFKVLEEHRYPEKNAAIMHVSFHLGLRAQEIALLRIQEIARLTDAHGGFELHEIMSLPKQFTKGANATKRSKTEYVRRTISMPIAEFDQAIHNAADLARAGGEVRPENFYPPVKKRKGGKSRDLPLVHAGLRAALERYLELRLIKPLLDENGAPKKIKASDPLFINQKGGPYSPNTLQDHMGMMLKKWTGIEKASSHSGRRSLATNILHTQKKPLKTAQVILGHINPSTTAIYTDPPEEELANALDNLDE